MSVADCLRGVHHIGVTVEDMERSFLFYTKVLGGTPITSGSGFSGDPIHNALLQKEELEAIQERAFPLALKGIPDLRSGQQKLDVRFIQFDNVVIELLQYHDGSKQPAAFRSQHPDSSPSFINSMHISFHLRDSVDPDEFVDRLEAAAKSHGFDKVKCNRTVAVRSEADRMAAPHDAKSFKIQGPPDAVGDFDGWTLIYCKGPDGEQLEFNHVARRAKALFDAAASARSRSQQNASL
eukprot:TRINITY_DN14558_c0_g1_i1.p1 TRINITY_DN14558_c0_g1~~TRINITY_DN14558_c0_g1_i1.p1  ORF type:complete len:237 (-),score=57.94 TRINITY_DN14558_c0_g1_i1:28-738(-)